jgi:hypothetical protein
VHSLRGNMTVHLSFTQFTQFKVPVSLPFFMQTSKSREAENLKQWWTILNSNADTEAASF